VNICIFGVRKTMAPKRRAAGFTLLELLIVVSIIAILASIAMPKFANVLQHAQEGSLKGNLGTMRSALSIYYADNNGIYPSCTPGPSSAVFANALVPKYISAIPVVKNSLHPATNSVYCDSTMLPGVVHDGQGWYFDGTLPTDSQNGSIWVACDHTDSKGTTWTVY
jgi:prepilin-type N-terminal cleavage/methylation domain-containing protein